MPDAEYDFWLLDLDGTLVDVEESYVHDVVDEVGRRLGVHFSEREAECLWYGYGEARNGLLARAGVDRKRFWETFHEVEQPETRAAATHLQDDAAEFLAALSGPVGVVTHCQSYLTRPVLSSLSIADRFDTVVCCTDETGWKPDPGPVESAMADLGVTDAQDGVLVGDDPGDVGAAWNAGLAAAHVRRHDPERTGRCVLGDHRVASLTELRAHTGRRKPR